MSRRIRLASGPAWCHIPRMLRRLNPFDALRLWLGARLGDMLHTIIQEIRKMGDTFHTDLAANTAAIQALAAEVSTGLASNAAAIQALKDQIAAGNPVTADDLATLEGNTAAVQAATDALTAALNPPTPTP